MIELIMNKYSFWIIPDNDFYAELEEIIAKYSAEYKAPVFTPHITIHNPVVSDDKAVVRKVQEAAQKLSPFEIQVGPVEFSTTYFQSVFVRMKTSAELLTAHMTLKESLGVTNDFVFMPHMSLVYGNFSMQVRAQIAREIKILIKSFQAKKITIARADSSDPKDWGIVAEVKLGAKTATT